MENKKAVTKEEAQEAVQSITHSIALTVAVCDMEYPGSKNLLLDVLIEKLEEMRGPKACHAEATTNACEKSHEQQCSTEAMTFGDALEALKQGKSVARKGWNGKNQFVELATCISYKGNAGEIVNCHHNNIGNKALAFVGTSGVQMGWLASQADMLAEDWYIVE